MVYLSLSECLYGMYALWHVCHAFSLPLWHLCHPWQVSRLFMCAGESSKRMKTRARDNKESTRRGEGNRAANAGGGERPTAPTSCVRQLLWWVMEVVCAPSSPPRRRWYAVAPLSLLSPAEKRGRVQEGGGRESDLGKEVLERCHPIPPHIFYLPSAQSQLCT